MLRDHWDINDLNHLDDFLRATVVIYERIPYSDRGLHNLVAETAFQDLNTLGKWKGLQELLHDIARFSADLVLKIARYRVQRMCTACTWIDPC